MSEELEEELYLVFECCEQTQRSPDTRVTFLEKFLGAV